MAANCGGIKPATPLWHHHTTGILRAGCQRGHRARITQAKLASRHRLSGETALYEIIARLRCSRYGAEACPAGV